jgi:hypothetical protein
VRTIPTRHILIGLSAMLTGLWSVATVLVTVDEALALAFPSASIDRETLFLTEAERRDAENLAGSDLAGAMVTRFAARIDGEIVGFGYLDTHRVRTLPQTLLIIIEPGGAVRRVEVVSFREPLDYLPPDGWYRQFDGEELNDDLILKGAIRPITGATLTARSTTEAVRRTLAIHAVTTRGGDGI